MRRPPRVSGAIPFKPLLGRGRLSRYLVSVTVYDVSPHLCLPFHVLDSYRSTLSILVGLLSLSFVFRLFRCGASSSLCVFESALFCLGGPSLPLFLACCHFFYLNSSRCTEQYLLYAFGPICQFQLSVCLSSATSLSVSTLSLSWSFSRDLSRLTSIFLRQLMSSCLLRV